MKRDRYRDAGVDIDAGDEVVDRIGKHVRSTYRDGVVGDIGGFGGFFRVPDRYREPLLVAGTDGVGTKLLLAQRLGDHSGIGIDLVAMCANDVAVCGAEPLFFLDYFATGKLDPSEAEAVIASIAEGCRQAGCALIGGETAEMPGMYAPRHYDLAGFCVGVVERSAVLDGRDIQAGDKLVGLPSSGVHSNGYSLVRHLLDKLPMDRDDWGLGAPLGEVLLRPTRIYVRELLALRQQFGLLGAVHITGGGFTGNVPRVLPRGLGAVMHKGSWPELPIFALLRAQGELSDEEMYRTFNCGLGMVLVVRPGEAEALAGVAGGFVVGEVVADEGGEARVV
ncbi:MAG: phosphoribosylformylglycinamidine cyclo-ligase [Deltaproteobacteria bacterium]|nr:phosphoribosylformylglycinamidine cyclo-ligase [Deltaproteobacteria bacterium]